MVIYTDGACAGNPGKGGWCAILLYKNHKKVLTGAFRKTTNNRMELMAVIEALKAIKNKDIPVIVYSDSQYVVDSVNKNYIQQWVNKQFKKVKNPDLWKELIELMKQFKSIRFEWVKGHGNNALNNECDALAVNAYMNENADLKADEYYEKTADNSGNNESSLFFE